MSEYAVGMVGLGVMGRNISFNMEEKGFSVAAFDAWPEPVDRFNTEGAGKNVKGFKDIGEMLKTLRRPRRVFLLIKAGPVTDKAIASIAPHLDEGDMIIDAGNEHFHETERRAQELSAKGIRFFGMGVSGGEVGARLGPSLMPGGDRQAYEELKPIFDKIAAQTEDGPCVTYCGPGGAGHYVKMVHNGIEYGDMQLIAETYTILKHIGGLTNAEMADVFADWNKGELQSFLIEITADIFKTKDPETGGELLDYVLDAAGMKGTGSWTVRDAGEIGSAIPTIASSVEARILSARKADRVTMSKILAGPTPKVSSADKQSVINDARAALYASKCCSYAQGLDLLRTSSNQRNWGFNLGEFARIWQAGCIIRAQFLKRIKAAYDRDANLVNLLVDGEFVEELRSRQDGWRRTISRAVESGVPVLSMAASLSYYDSIRTERLGANMIQAQRDCFGAHTYKRIDKEGDHHTKWR